MRTDGPSHIHEALFYGSDDEFLSGAVPFLRAGLDAGESISIIGSDHNDTLLLEALGHDPRVVRLPRGDMYRRSSAAIASYQQMVTELVEAGAPRVRLFGEVQFGERPAGWREWGRYEAVFNRAFSDLPLWNVCTYDTRHMPAEVLTIGRLTHPSLVRGTTHVANPDYLEPVDYLHRVTPTASDPLEATAPTLEVDDLSDLHALRDAVNGVLAGSAESESVADFVLAVDEVVTNALRHGRRPVRVRLWSTRDRCLCTVTDQGDGCGDPFAGYLAASMEDLPTGGMGLWLVRQLCEKVELARTAQGFTVRLATSY